MSDYIIFDDYVLDDFSKFNMVITVNPIMEVYDEEEFERVYNKCGKAIASSVRTRDYIVREGNHFYLSLSDMNKEKELDVVDRLRNRLVDEGVYFFADTVIDARLPGVDMKYNTWYKVAV